MTAANRLILSIFPGVGLLDRAFEELGLCVVRGPDLLWGGDIRRFDPPEGVFWGVIGGPPCQDFSAARRAPPTDYGRAMLAEYCRVVERVKPAWWLLENVARVPEVLIRPYIRQRFELDQGWFAPVSRLRHFQYGFRLRPEDPAWHAYLDPPRGRLRPDCVPAALACDDRPWPVVRQLQGLPDDYDLHGMTAAGKVHAVGNGVPLVLGRLLASLILDAHHVTDQADRCDVSIAAAVTDQAKRCDRLLRCACGCGRTLRGRQRYASCACRKRAERTRRRDSPDATV